MNKIASVLLQIVSLGAVGAAGYYVGKSMEAKRSEEEIADARAHYKAKLEAVEGRIKELEDHIEHFEKSSIEAPSASEEPAESKASKARNKKPITSYDKVIDEIEASKEETKKKTPKKTKKDIYVISYDLYEKDEDYEKVMLNYFKDDEVFLDDEDNIIESIPWLDDSILSKFGSDPDEYEDILYVRNEPAGIDYEIVLKDNIAYEDYLIERYEDK